MAAEEEQKEQRQQPPKPNALTHEEQQQQPPKPNALTHAQFLSWKRQKDADAVAKREEAARKRAEDIASGAVQMNGRDLFLHEPWVFDNTRY